MAKQVVLSPLALINVENIFNYLNSDWGPDVADTFSVRLLEVIEQLERNPDIYQFYHRSRKIQRCVIGEQNTMYFRQTDEYIDVITIFDTRQDPKKLRQLLK